MSKLGKRGLTLIPELSGWQREQQNYNPTQRNRLPSRPRQSDSYVAANRRTMDAAANAALQEWLKSLPDAVAVQLDALTPRSE